LYFFRNFSRCPTGSRSANRPPGITDVDDLLDGPNRKTYAVMWLGSLENQVAITT
jgi:hypothetical protein